MLNYHVYTYTIYIYTIAYYATMHTYILIVQTAYEHISYN